MLTLHRLGLGHRVLYTAVLVFMTAGTVVHGVHQQARAGVTPSGVAHWYRGNEDEPDATRMLFQRSFEEVWGDVWTALTTWVLALMIFGSIMARSATPSALRAGLVGGYALAGLASAAAPLLVRYVAPGFAYLESAALLVLPLLALGMTALAAWEMWLQRAEGPRLDTGRTA